MVSPKQPAGGTAPAHSSSSSSKGTSTNSTLLLVIKILLVLLILFLLPRLVTTKPIKRRVKNKRQLNRRYRDIRSRCEDEVGEKDTCGDLVYEESTPCVTKCISSMCHDKIYGDNPLELGEVDRVRYAEFELCAKKEIKEAARMERIEKRRKQLEKE